MTHGVDEPAVGTRGPDADRRTERLADLLDDPHCRYLLSYLESVDGPVPVADAVSYVVSEITQIPVDEVSPEVQRRVQTWFYNGQLPILDEFGVVEFDPDAGTVELAEDALE